MQEQGGVMAPLIAVIGCDGSGKSTVAGHIVSWVGRYGHADTVHLGKQSGNVGRALARLPLLGSLLDRVIQRKVDGTNKRMGQARLPSLLPALVISAFTLRRLHRFRRMLAMRRRGLIVITDRYPQVEISGAYDGPGFPDVQTGSALVLALARRERRVFAWMASHRPDVVLRLNVDLDVACARKPDHRRESLSRKIAATPQLKFSGAPIVDIDANQSLEQVIKAAEAVVARVMEARGYRASTT